MQSEALELRASTFAFGDTVQPGPQVSVGHRVPWVLPGCCPRGLSHRAVPHTGLPSLAPLPAAVGRATSCLVTRPGHVLSTVPLATFGAGSFFAKEAAACVVGCAAACGAPVGTGSTVPWVMTTSMSPHIAECPLEGQSRTQSRVTGLNRYLRVWGFFNC